MENITAFLPAGAFDLRVKNFVARWKTPNSYTATGFVGDSRFLAASFLAAIRGELEDLKSWQIVNYDGEPATAWTDRAALTDGEFKLWATTRGYGAKAYSKVNLQGYAIAATGKYSSAVVIMSASLDRPAAAIAKDIARHILPAVAAAKDEARAKAKAESDRVETVTGKVAELAKRYPNLRIRGDAEHGRVRIESKYGAKIRLDSYTYKDSKSGIWCLTTERGYCFGLDDIDSKSGRAFLKLANDA